MNGSPTQRSSFWTSVAWILLTFFVSYAVAVALPLGDPSLWAAGDLTPKRGKAANSGKAIYDREGCVYCHSQSVRPVGIDLSLGKVTHPAQSANDHPSSLGIFRYGPDLSCVADRFESPEMIGAHVSDPRSATKSSNMPGFAYLSPEELSDLSAYLFSLSCK